jgi:hypothetical protein
MRLQGPELAGREKGGPASCGPNAEPPIVPESFAVLPSRAESREALGPPRLSHTPPGAGNAPEVEALPSPKSWAKGEQG